MSHHVATPALIGQSFLVENRLAKQRKFKIRLFFLESQETFVFLIFEIFDSWEKAIFQNVQFGAGESSGPPSRDLSGVTRL